MSESSSAHLMSSPTGSVALRPVHARGDILPPYRGTPIGELLRAHALRARIEAGAAPELLVVTCMDHRVRLSLPPGFAFEVRTAGACFEPVRSNIAFAVAVAGIRHLAIIGHTDCAMGVAHERGGAMVDHLVSAEGWSPEDAAAEHAGLCAGFALEEVMQTTLERARELARAFPSCLVAPLLYDVGEHALSQIETVDA